MRHTFRKSERLCSRKQIDDLFGGGAQSVSAFPIRAVFKPSDTAPTQTLMSVAKRRLRHAVDRNRAKRQMREAYRLNKEMLHVPSPLRVAFVWLSAEPVESGRVVRAMRSVLQKINESAAPTAD
ncbi:MAG: ribonuclease P protein component [Bacteroidaceae bacterium]|nr:ribonuclease P protein component [Bacteroidaceae bacterium]